MTEPAKLDVLSGEPNPRELEIVTQIYGNKNMYVARMLAAYRAELEGKHEADRAMEHAMCGSPLQLMKDVVRLEAELAEARATIAQAQREHEERDVCEVCGDCLMPRPPRCERHAHTEPGDEEWTHGAEDAGRLPEAFERGFEAGKLTGECK